jgi:hypothetical protein
VNRIEKLQRHFLWGGIKEEFKFHLVNWSTSLPETTSEVSSGLVLNRIPLGGLEVTTLGATEGASPASLVFVGDSFRSEPSLAAVTGTAPFMSSSGGESSSSQVFSVSSSQTPASKEFGFPPSPALDLGFLADPAPSSAPVFKFTPLGPLQIPRLCFVPLSLAGAAILGEKLHSPLLVVVSKPFSVLLQEGEETKGRAICEVE